MLPEGMPPEVPHRCPQCGAENPADAHYCGNCGAQLRSQFDRPAGPVNLGSDAVSEHAAPNVYAAPAAPAAPTAPAAPATPEDTAWQAQVYTPAQVPQQPAPPHGPPPPVDTPGAGISPGYAPPMPQGQTRQQPQVVSQQVFYPGNFEPGMNTSGMGEGYPLPPEASGWTWGGFVPFGLFGFMNNNTMWGVFGLLTWILGFQLIYSIVVGVTGKQMAWKSRRFDSVEQYELTMKGWNTAGLFCFIAGVVLVVAFIVMYIAIIALAISTEGWN
jgi:hypothetical protein